ncbi:MAG: hypothetical protein HQ581_29335 [Planctomycetes bacterium]|nr:hypothetical protein [Planctomycetota bacterium]
MEQEALAAGGREESSATETRPARHWCLRHWKWLLPATLAGFCLLAVAVGGITLLWIASDRKNSPPYQMALKQVQQSADVIARLGEPVEGSSFLPAGKVHVEDGRGEANLNFDVAGPDGTANVRVQAKCIAGQWGLAALAVTFADGKRIPIDLPRPEATVATGEGGAGSEWPDAGGVAPPWQPEVLEEAGPPPSDVSQPDSANAEVDDAETVIR